MRSEPEAAAPATVAASPDQLPTTAPQRRLRAMILWYQRLRDGRPSPCRFFPSCSSYALEAIEVHGTRRGGWLTLRRLARCRPLGPSGFDPVPLPVAPPEAPSATAPPADASPDGDLTAPAPKGR